MQLEPISLLNTALPIFLLAMLAVMLPAVFAPSDNLSQAVLLRAVAATALLIVLIGAVLFAATYQFHGAEVLNAMSQIPRQTAAFFIETSLKASLVWGPVLGLVWLIRAQGVEKRKGEAAARETRP